MTLPNTCRLLMQTLCDLDTHWAEAEIYLQKLGEQAKPVLRSALQSGTVHQRVNAIRLLEREGHVSSISDLLALQQHEHPWVRMAAAKALSSMPHWATASGLLDWLNIEQNPMVQVWIVTSLGRVGDEHVLPHLIDALDTANGEMLVYTILSVLGELGDESVIEVIHPYLNDEASHVRKYAQDALQKIQNRIEE